MSRSGKSTSHPRRPKARPVPTPAQRTRAQPHWVKITILSVLVLGAIASVITSLRTPSPSPLTVAFNIPNLNEAERIGLGYFTMHCQVCHGENGRGTRAGPPLVHKIYEPSHHGDGAFVRAARQGVVAHHWRFGNMPALPAVTDHEVNAIIRYVRALQRANGIY